MDYIYALCDPRDNRVRYIGKTNNLRRRYGQHLIEKTNTHRTHWIQSLIEIGLAPHLIVIEEIAPEQDWEERERLWIARYRAMSNDLTNGSDGGDCGPRTKKGSKKSPQTRAKMGAWQVGRKLPKETRDKIRTARKGKKPSPETIDKIRVANTGKKMHSDEFKRKLAERNRTRPYNPESMREKAKNLWDDPIKAEKARAKLIERNKRNKWHSKDRTH